MLHVGVDSVSPAIVVARLRTAPVARWRRWESEEVLDECIVIVAHIDKVRGRDLLRVAESSCALCGELGLGKYREKNRRQNSDDCNNYEEFNESEC